VGTEKQSRLDEAKIETLRVWGEGLSGDVRDEVRAAGRAITMLVEEIERLNVDLWNERAKDIRFAEPPSLVEREQSLQRALRPRFGNSSA
jgi:hypothetical protein